MNRFGLEKLSTIRHVTPRGPLEPGNAEKKLSSHWFRTYTAMTHNGESYRNSDRGGEEPKMSRSFLLYLVAGVVLCAETNKGLLWLMLCTSVELISFTIDRKFVNAAKEGDIAMLRKYDLSSLS